MSMEQVKAEATQARDNALHSAELAQPAAEEADTLAARLGSIVTGLREIAEQVDGIRGGLDFNVKLPMAGATEYSRQAYEGFGAASDGARSEAVDKIGSGLDQAYAAAQAAETAANATGEALESLAAIVSAATTKAEGTWANMIGNPCGDDGSPYGVMSSAVVAGEQSLAAANGITKWLPTL